METLRPIVIADDDLDDSTLIKKAFEANKVLNPLVFVSNGEELLSYLENNETPAFIFLDLNMPKMDGREALEKIKLAADYKSTPVIVMTNSDAEEDVAKSYKLGVNSYVQKPITFDALVKTVKSVTGYWLAIVKLPN